MRYNLFLHYGWFFQNLGKEAVQTNMHTTVLNDLIQFLSSEVSTSKPVSKMQGHGSQCFSLLMNDLITSKKTI